MRKILDKKVATYIAACIFLVVMAASAYSEPLSIPSGAMCVECGMKVDGASIYACQIAKDEKLAAFCDIGDMLSHYKKMHEKPGEVYVKDSKSNEWTDATAAFYVKDEKSKTPMGWGITAFRSKEDASAAGHPMTFHEAISMLGEGGHGMKKHGGDMKMDEPMKMH